jgi:hypothetical protein
MPRSIRSDHQHPSISAWCQISVRCRPSVGECIPRRGSASERLQLLVQGRGVLELGHLDPPLGEQVQRVTGNSSRTGTFHRRSSARVFTASPTITTARICPPPNLDCGFSESCAAIFDSYVTQLIARSAWLKGPHERQPAGLSRPARRPRPRSWLDLGRPAGTRSRNPHSGHRCASAWRSLSKALVSSSTRRSRTMHARGLAPALSWPR